MATHSSTLAWKIPWTVEPGGLQSMGSLRVRHDWATSLSLFTFMRWRRKWHHSSVLAWRIPGTEEPGGLPSIGSHRVGRNWSDLAAHHEKRWAGGSINLRDADYTTLMAESEEELKSLLMKVKEESEKVDLKLNIQKTKIMASGPITSWQIDGDTVKTVRDFIFGFPKSLQMVTAALKLKDACSLKEKLWPT